MLEGDVKASKQYQMLINKYQQCVVKQDLYNAIYMVQREKASVKKDVFNLLNSLLDKKNNESGWVVKYQLDVTSQALTHLL